MHRHSGLAALVAAVALGAIALAGCGSSSDSKAAAAAKPLAGKVVGFSVPIEANVTLHAIGDGLAAEVEREGGTVKILDAQGSPETQLTDIRQLVSDHVSALVVAPLAWASVRNELRLAAARKIPVLVHDAVLTDPTKASLAPANFQVLEPRAAEAAQAAKLLTASGHASGGTLAMSFCANGPTFQKLTQVLASSLPQDGGKLLSTVCNSTDDANGAFTVAQSALTRFPHAGGFWAYNDASAIGIAKAATKAGDRSKLEITGLNGEPQGIAAVKSGEIDATWDYNPVEIGQTLGKAAAMLVTGKGSKLPVSVEAQTKEYTKANVSSYVPWPRRVAEVKAGKYIGVPLGG